MTNTRRPIIDTTTSTNLPNSWTAATAIYPNGEEVLWLLAPDDTNEPGCACPVCAPHEQLTSPGRPNATITVIPNQRRVPA